MRRGVISNLALVIGTCATLHSHWSFTGFEPRSTVPVQSVVPSITFIVHNDWWFIVVYVIYSLPAVYFGLSAAIHLKSHLQLPLLSNKNKRSSKLLHGMHCVCGYSSFRLNVLLIPVSQVHTQVYVLGNLINVKQFFFNIKLAHWVLHCLFDNHIHPKRDNSSHFELRLRSQGKYPIWLILNTWKDLKDLSSNELSKQH